MKPVAPAAPPASLDLDPMTAEVLEQLRSFDPYEQYFALLSLSDLGRPDLLPAALPLLNSQHPDLRYVAIQTIGELGKGHAEQYGPFLVPMLESEDAELREHAAEALGELDYQESIPAIERMLLKETDEETRRFTLRALRILRREATEEDLEPIYRMMMVDFREELQPESEIDFKPVIQ